jgi:hypothetical protein
MFSLELSKIARLFFWLDSSTPKVEPKIEESTEELLSRIDRDGNGSSTDELLHRLKREEHENG